MYQVTTRFTTSFLHYVLFLSVVLFFSLCPNFTVLLVCNYMSLDAASFFFEQLDTPDLQVLFLAVRWAFGHRNARRCVGIAVTYSLSGRFAERICGTLVLCD